MLRFRNYIIPVVTLLMTQSALGESRPRTDTKTFPETLARFTLHRSVKHNSLQHMHESAETTGTVGLVDQEIAVRKGHLYLDFGKKVAKKKVKAPFLIRRAKGRLGDYQTIAKVMEPKFIDKAIQGSR